MRAVRRHAELDGADVRLERVSERRVHQPLGQRGGALRTERRDQACLGVARLRGFCEHDDHAARHSYSLASRSGGVPIQYSQRSRHISAIVRKTPSRSQRRPDVVTCWRRHAGADHLPCGG